MSRLGSFSVAALLLLACVSVPCVTVAQSASGTKTLSDTVSLNKTGTVEIDNQKGSIEVTTWNRAAVGYEVTLEPTDQDSALVSNVTIDQSDELVEFDFTDSWSIHIPGIVRISPGGASHPVAHYRVRIPVTARLEISDHESNIRISDVQADVEIESFAGDVQVDSVKGILTLDTHEGTVTATNLRGGIAADVFDGTVDATFEAFSDSSAIDSHSGTIRLRFPEETGFTLEGELDDADLVVEDTFGSPRVEQGRREYEGGGPPISIETFSGRIEIHSHTSERSSSTP